MHTVQGKGRVHLNEITTIYLLSCRSKLQRLLFIFETNLMFSVALLKADYTRTLMLHRVHKDIVKKK